MTASQGIEQLALSWLVLDLTGSVGQLGLVMFIRGLPMAGIALYGGVMADRYNRRTILMYCQALIMVNLFLLAALTIAGTVTVWHVYVSSLLLGVTWSLTQPARQALLRELVPAEDLGNAVALNTMQMMAARVAWPTFAGVCITLIGVGGTLLTCGVGYVVGIVFLAMIHGLAEVTPSERGSAVSEMVEGIRYAAATPIVGTVIIMSTAVGVFGLAVVQLTPAFGRTVLGFDAGLTGVFMMSSGVGSIIGSSALLWFHFKNRALLFIVLFAGFSLSILGIAASPWPPAAFVFMSLFGLFLAAYVVVAQTIFQETVPDRLLGRVLSLWSFGGGLGAVFALPLGVIGDTFGLRWAFGGTALLLLLITLAVGVRRVPLQMPATEEPAPRAV
jgi:MFS family permease